MDVEEDAGLLKFSTLSPPCLHVFQQTWLVLSILSGVHGSGAIHTDEQLLKVHNDFTFISTVWIPVKLMLINS